MAQRDYRNHQQQDAWREPNQHRQMGQYADDQRQYGGQYADDNSHDARNWGARNHGSDLSRHDPAQASYGRAGAPEVRGAPSGGYQRDWQADPGYNEPGYMRNPSYQGYGSRDERSGPGYGGYDRPGYRNRALQRDSWRSHGGYDEGRDWERQRGYGGEGSYAYGQDRYQGGSGGYRSNSGPYAGSQTYGGYGDQLGYGSYQGNGHQGQQHVDPDYQQWREQQLRNLDDDYQSWRGERYKKFSDEFDTWRKNRQGAEQKNDLPGSAGSAGSTSNNTGKNTGGSGNK